MACSRWEWPSPGKLTLAVTAALFFGMPIVLWAIAHHKWGR